MDHATHSLMWLYDRSSVVVLTPHQQFLVSPVVISKCWELQRR
ncbi:hypothetical protein ACLB1Q_26370 [Escherichia coli]